MEININDAPCLYFSSLDDGKLIAYNQYFCQQLGYQSDALMGEKVEKIFPVATKIFFQTHLFPLLTMQGYANEIFVTLLTSGNQQLPVLLNAERKIVEGNAIINYVALVVHNRKKFEDELVAARKAAETALNENTQLVEAKRLLQESAEALDQQLHHVNNMNAEFLQFNRVVTHDLQEPLRKLFVFTNMLLEAEANAANNKTVMRIKSAVEQMRTIVSGLQQFVWLAETKPRPVLVDLSKTLRLIRSELEITHPAVEINLAIGELGIVYADREQIQFLLREILSNAVRFRKHPTKVFLHISATNICLNQFKAVHDKYKYQEYLRIEIKDEGIGFDAAYKDQAFELFKRLHPDSGQGIGLSLCKKIIENHDGIISIDSVPGKGTAIFISLPFVHKPSSNQEVMERQNLLIPRNENEKESDFVR